MTWAEYLSSKKSKPATSQGFSMPSESAPRKRGKSESVECSRPHFAPVGSKGVPGKPGLWQIWVSDEEVDAEPPY